MGRALVREPKVFLFDEPLSNLDAQLRVDMRTEIKRLHQRLGTTIVYVTHDQIEAMTMATRIAVMKDGHIVQCGTPAEIYEQPANVFVARFVGSPAMNFVPGVLVEQSGRLHVDLNRSGGEADPSLVLPVGRGDASERAYAGRKVIVGIRPESIGVAHGPAPAAGGNPIVQRRIDVVEPTGADTLAIFDIAGVEVMARLRPHEARGSGLTNFILDPAAFHLFDRETEERLPIPGPSPADATTLHLPDANAATARSRSQRQ
jgi:multiple sugar transport system ATP-binding protein